MTPLRTPFLASLSVPLLLLVGCSKQNTVDQSEKNSYAIDSTTNDNLPGPDGLMVALTRGSVKSATTIVISQAVPSEFPAVPAGFNVAGAVYAFEPHNFVFEQPILLSLPAGDGDGAITAEPGGSWVPITAARAGLFMQIQTNHFSYYAVTSSAGPLPDTGTHADAAAAPDGGGDFGGAAGAGGSVAGGGGVAVAGGGGAGGSTAGASGGLAGQGGRAGTAGAGGAGGAAGADAADAGEDPFGNTCAAPDPSAPIGATDAAGTVATNYGPIAFKAVDGFASVETMTINGGLGSTTTSTLHLTFTDYNQACGIAQVSHSLGGRTSEGKANSKTVDVTLRFDSMDSTGDGTGKPAPGTYNIMMGHPQFTITGMGDCSTMSPQSAPFMNNQSASITIDTIDATHITGTVDAGFTGTFDLPICAISSGPSCCMP